MGARFLRQRFGAIQSCALESMIVPRHQTIVLCTEKKGPIHGAVDRVHLIKSCLACGINVNSSDKWGDIALHLAVRLEEIEYMLEPTWKSKTDTETLRL